MQIFPSGPTLGFLAILHASDTVGMSGFAPCSLDAASYFAELWGAGIGPKPYPRKCAAEKGRPIKLSGSCERISTEEPRTSLEIV